LEFPNLYRLSAASREQVRQQLGTKIERDDLRDAVSRRAQKLLEEHSVPVTARMAGMFALDLAIAGVDKARAVEVALSGTVLDSLGMAKLPTPGEIEVWGDRFSRELGTDWLMCRCAPYRSETNILKIFLKNTISGSGMARIGYRRACSSSLKVDSWGLSRIIESDHR
jgi:hypothetical protein